MFQLVRHLTLILGEYVPKDDGCWSLLVMCKQLTEIFIAPTVHHNLHHALEILISEYLECLCELFTQPMKPKHHFLIHFPNVMKVIGVVWKASCIRSEGKHKEGKDAAKNTTSRLNVCRSIAIRQQLIQNYRFLNSCDSSNGSYAYKSVKYVKLQDLSLPVLQILSNLKYFKKYVIESVFLFSKLLFQKNLCL